MKNFVFMFLLVFVVALVQATQPPGEKISFTEEVSAVVNVESTFVAIENSVFVVREVTHQPLYSISITVNKAPEIDINQELTALTNTTTDIEFTLKHPPTLYTSKGKYKNIEINRKNCNYGYPFSANRFFS